MTWQQLTRHRAPRSRISVSGGEILYVHWLHHEARRVRPIWKDVEVRANRHGLVALFALGDVGEASMEAAA